MITSGSGLERYINCLGSSVLPRALDADGSKYSERGKELHAFLQRIGEGAKVDVALEMVDERYRGDAAAIDLEHLRDVLGLTCEMTFAYNPVFDTARVLGVGLEREYVAAGLTEDEIPATMDVVGLNSPTNPTIGKVVDYKFGWSKLTPAARNWQMIGGALCISRVYDLDEVGVQLIHMRDKLPARRDIATFSPADLAIAAAQTRARWDEVLRAREHYERTRIEPEVTKGAWCRHCPSYHACGAQMALVRAATSREVYEEPVREGSLAQADVARVFLLLEDLEEPRKRLLAACYAAAKERPVLLRTEEDGTEVWLGITEVTGNTKLDADKARTLAREMLGARNDGKPGDPADEISIHQVSLDRIEAAIKLRVPKGKGAATMRTFLDELKRRGGAPRPVRHEVDLYKIRPQQRALKAG